MKRRAVVAMSGGVDSSVAAALIKEDGYDVTGIMLKLWQGEAANNDSGCCSLDAAEDARRVAQVLDIPFYVLNFADRFSKAVIEPFKRAYASGMTPNPCIECNRSIKFAALMDRARAYDADVLVTGHYVRSRKAGAGWQLMRGIDRTKDQSYVLYMLDQEELAASRFPVGEHTKDEVRQIAASLGLRTAMKAESQEICFVPAGDSHAFITEALPEASIPGPIETVGGKVIGTHKGFGHYTVGQRRGLGIGLGVPLYVREVRAADNTLVVGAKSQLSMRSMYLSDVSFVSSLPTGGLTASVMTRYRGPEATATIEDVDGSWTVTFDEEQPPAAPGQAAVFYDEDVVIGGGTITSTK